MNAPIPLLYRSDMRPFGVGDVMPHGRDHIDDMEGEQLIVENLLRQHPDYGSMRKSIYAFSDRAWAEKYWALRASKKKLFFYELKAEEADIRRIADFNLFNQAVADAENRDQLLKQFWDGGRSSNPQLEYMLAQATVVTVLGTHAEQKAALDRLYKSP